MGTEKSAGVLHRPPVVNESHRYYLVKINGVQKNNKGVNCPLFKI